MTKHIPNFITSMNLFAGCMAVYYGFQGNYELVLLFVLLAAVFDFLDGLAARLLHAYSPMGKELDSLADVVSFGVAPGVLVLSLLMQTELPQWMAFAGFIIPVFSALRLAKFNIDDRQTTSFIGLPTPANGLFWVGLGYSYPELLTANSWYILVFTVIFSGLLVSELPMFSLKFKNLKWKDNQVQYVFLLVSILLIVLFQVKALALVIAWYIVLSVLLVFFKRIAS
ncbi:MAG: CDP-diacylglycerol--serine O-phosphatidyltransferase [Paludibacter sp.]